MKIIYKCSLEITDTFEDSEVESINPAAEITDSITESLTEGLSKNGTVNITGDSVEVIR